MFLNFIDEILLAGFFLAKILWDIAFLIFF